MSANWGAVVADRDPESPMNSTWHAVCDSCPDWRGDDWPMTAWGQRAAADDLSRHVREEHQS